MKNQKRTAGTSFVSFEKIDDGIYSVSHSSPQTIWILGEFLTSDVSWDQINEFIELIDDTDCTSFGGNVTSLEKVNGKISITFDPFETDDEYTISPDQLRAILVEWERWVKSYKYSFTLWIDDDSQFHFADGGPGLWFRIKRFFKSWLK